MDTSGSIAHWRRIDHLEYSMCSRVNRACRYPSVKAFFATVSRLGDGGFWYLLMLLLVLNGPGTAWIAGQMALTGLVALALYRHLKERLVRERPYVSHAGIEPGTAPLDRYSFPSGHTLHAVCFTTVAITHVPELALLLVPFTVLVAASRVVLGMHYPSDVLAGAVIGLLLARTSLVLWAG
jgi:undecaprenyl-diphosphatase